MEDNISEISCYTKNNRFFIFPLMVRFSQVIQLIQLKLIKHFSFRFCYEKFATGHIYFLNFGKTNFHCGFVKYHYNFMSHLHTCQNTPIYPKKKVLHFIWDDHHATCFKQLPILGHIVCSGKDTNEWCISANIKKMSYSNFSILLP
jgi:hypothetical protein